jgi:hypothetical protein
MMPWHHSFCVLWTMEPWDQNLRKSTLSAGSTARVWCDARLMVTPRRARGATS